MRTFNQKLSWSLHNMCVCLFVCPSAAAAGKPLGFQLHPSESQSICDLGFWFLNPREAGDFTSTRKGLIRGQTRDKIRGRIRG